jgi:hypothetical protein
MTCAPCGVARRGPVRSENAPRYYARKIYPLTGQASLVTINLTATLYGSVRSRIEDIEIYPHQRMGIRL